MVRQPDDRGELGRFLAPRRLPRLYAAALRQLARRRVFLYGDARTLSPGYQRGVSAGALQTADLLGPIPPVSWPRLPHLYQCRLSPPHAPASVLLHLLLPYILISL